MGDGGTIASLGQKSLNMSDGRRKGRSICQIAAAIRPLMSVGRIRDEGHNIALDAALAVPAGSEICRFHRTPGGHYLAKMKLKNPLGLAQQE